MSKVYEIDPMVCPKGGSEMKVIAVIQEPELLILDEPTSQLDIKNKKTNLGNFIKIIKNRSYNPLHNTRSTVSSKSCDACRAHAKFKHNAFWYHGTNAYHKQSF